MLKVGRVYMNPEGGVDSSQKPTILMDILGVNTNDRTCMILKKMAEKQWNKKLTLDVNRCGQWDNPRNVISPPFAWNNMCQANLDRIIPLRLCGILLEYGQMTTANQLSDSQ
jgi:hypothetical protein